ncbi:MAG TPA: hypothetical protein VLD40_07375 [Dissulfurispiraceae bacterium]|nr:hypothetical protein [Dissulfurispiraceae bacterium]
MKHIHDYETVYHQIPTAEVKALGVKATEIRKCKTCQKEMPFVQIRDTWVQLFEDREYDEKDILLA